MNFEKLGLIITVVAALTGCTTQYSGSPSATVIAGQAVQSRIW